LVKGIQYVTGGTYGEGQVERRITIVVLRSELTLRGEVLGSYLNRGSCTVESLSAFLLPVVNTIVLNFSGMANEMHDGADLIAVPLQFAFVGRRIVGKIDIISIDFLI
jgi:hypothetical protein